MGVAGRSGRCVAAPSAGRARGGGRRLRCRWLAVPVCGCRCPGVSIRRARTGAGTARCGCGCVAALQTTAQVRVRFRTALHRHRKSATVQVAAVVTQTMKSIQETYAPELACFGGGPANPRALHIRSFPEGEEGVAEWRPSREYEAYEGMLSG